MLGWNAAAPDGAARALDDRAQARMRRRMQRIGLWIVSDDPETVLFLSLRAAEVQIAVRSFSDAQTFLRAFRPLHAACVVIDARLDGHRGVVLEHHVVGCKRAVPVIMITGQSDVATAVDAMRGGAFDVLERPLTAARVVVCLERAIAERHRLYEGQLRRYILERRLSRLTSRERDVLQLVICGLTSRDIGAQLGVQEKTIEVYRSRINQKMHARNVADLVGMLHGVRAGELPAPGRPVESPALGRV